MEEIIGRRGRNYLLTIVDHFDEKHIRPHLQRRVHRRNEDIIDMYHKVALEIHLATIELTSDEDREARDKITQKLSKNLQQQINDSEDSPKELQNLITYPNLRAETEEAKSVAVNIEAPENYSLEKLRAAVRIIHLISPTRRIKSSEHSRTE